ncbi:putative protein 150-kD protein cluA [Heterostelium album PN500]|uniref:Clu domain-containing protein n=1 Tax=Heterostelium pallidum (strain ATCC 26659 / Pp 5 / PN500) TaxID=670386 RepID=D3BQT0_HETP5|nr:putative protein 150-kD protein cluA [Heterostelium album PN500]EFA76500.1 putative protein 150-kD protein cluA [Heterostelium album PN500]|eukprot:XP_020428632.1 putative protein 150-kD protein cluA [Heterostelium album PN500]
MYNNISNNNNNENNNNSNNNNSSSMSSSKSNYSIWSQSQNYSTMTTSMTSSYDNVDGSLPVSTNPQNTNKSRDSMVKSDQSVDSTGSNNNGYGSSYGSCYNITDNSYSDSYRSLYSNSYNNNSNNTNGNSNNNNIEGSVGYSSYGDMSDYGGSGENNNSNGYGYGDDEDDSKKEKQQRQHKLHNTPKVNVFDIYNSAMKKKHGGSGFTTSESTDSSSPNSGDWNKRFQSIMDRPESGLKYQLLSVIVNDFVHCASTFGKIIIAERYLSNDEKTIKPLALGGVAGGEKYRCNDIVFKFVVDVEIADGVWMYGGDKRSDEKAQKSAGHELKGWNHVFDAGSSLIRLPLMTIIDFAGYRLLAICSLPIGKKTIVYGSNDGGITVNNRDSLVEKEMVKLARKLNLKGHQVGLMEDTKTLIFGPGDIEVHRGTDGRYYMIDFARIFPPEYSGIYKESIGREIFYYMLRPELVESNSVPLSSDAFTAWQHSSESEESNQEVVDTTQRLHDLLIPECVEHINDEVAGQNQMENQYFETENLVRDLKYYQQQLSSIEKLLHIIHLKGINFRYIGTVCQSITHINTKRLLFTEVVARVWKKIIKDRLRDLVEISNRPSDKAIIIFTELFDLLLNKSKEAKEKYRDFWSLVRYGSFKYTAMSAFPNCLSSNQMNIKYDLRNSVDTKILVLRLIKIFGIRVRSDSFNHFINSASYVISSHDIESVGAVVKYPMIVDFAYGSCLLYRAQRGIEENSLAPIDLQRLMTMSQQKLQSALSSMPNSSKVILKQVSTFVLRSDLTTNCNEAIHLLDKANNLLKQQQQNSEETTFDETNPITTTPTPTFGVDSNTLALGGLILLKLATYKLFLQYDFPSFTENLTLAIEKFESSLEQDSDYVEMYLRQLLPFDSDHNGELGVVPNTPSIIADYRRNEFLTLIYMLSMCIEESSKLRPFTANLISEIRFISAFEIPLSVEQLFDNSVTVHLFTNIANVTHLSVTNYTLQHDCSHSIARLQHLTSLKFTNISFSQSGDIDDPAIQTYNHFLRELLTNAPMLTELTLSSGDLDDTSFEGIPQLMGNIDSLSLIQCALTDKTFIEIGEQIGSQLKRFEIFSRYDSSGEKGLASLLGKLNSVRELDIHYKLSKETSKEILPFASNLERFSCSSAISAEHLAEIAKLAEDIVELDLSFTSADDSVIHALASHGAKRLKLLKFGQTNIGREQDSTIIPTLTTMNLDLTVLHLNRYNGEASALWALLSSLPNLVELRMPEYLLLPKLLAEYNSNDYEPLGSELSELRVLDLMLVNVSSASLVELLSLSPMIESISFSAASVINDCGYVLEMDDNFFEAILPYLGNVKYINLANTSVQKNHIDTILAQCKSISSIDIYNCKTISAQIIYNLGVEYPYVKFK